MSQQNQLVGIIEIDADPRLSVPADDTIRETLRRLRCQCDATVNGDSVELWADGRADQEFACESVHILKADLRQLRADLESELGRLLDQLLTTS
jgi:hypothetical protein